MPAPMQAQRQYPPASEVMAQQQAAPQPGAEQQPNPLVDSLRTLNLFVTALREKGQEEPMARFIDLISSIRGGGQPQGQPAQAPQAEQAAPMPPAPQAPPPMAAAPMPAPAPVAAAPMPAKPAMPMGGSPMGQASASMTDKIVAEAGNKPRPRPMNRGQLEQKTKQPTVLA
jgi:hypothetical protein